jgi:rubredoxin
MDRLGCGVSGHRGAGPAVPDNRAAGPGPVVNLACTACQYVYQPDLADFDTGNTGCPRCGGWTWIAQLDTTSASDGGGGAG